MFKHSALRRWRPHWSASASSSFASHVRAGGDKVVFPEGFDKGVLYTTVDRADNKQYREIYTSQAAVDAAKKGQPMPDGTVVTLIQYKAKLDAQGNPGEGRQRALHQDRSSSPTR